ncbi:MAG TPA: hypothetical protein DCL61_28635 [Cyanobacteria bacterium UBA12227]|nr:hypothetical protein [Cyanobacteria bacterium UBA12227]HAX85680.1 hypothetical protein [Cyanobacteria bacterium UBA11370]HBY81810.1 hypothetical protein [Cyanobacteria bacterium UBA11148]
MPSLNPPLTKDDFINSRWQDVINRSNRKECVAYSEGFRQKAEEAKEAGNVREQAVFEILAYVTYGAIKPDSTEEFFAEIFQNLTDEHLDFLTEIAPEISDPELQARVADILWVKRRNYQMAQLAVSAYLQSATALEDSDHWTWCFQKIERTLRLARTIRYQVETVVAHIEAILNYQQKVEQSDPWVKFAGMFKDDPLFDEFVEDMAAYRRELDAEASNHEPTSEENQPA